MEREFFLKTNRVGFSRWLLEDIGLAMLLWGDPKVTRYLCARGLFSASDIADRLDGEIRNGALYQVQYWPVFELATGDLIGCCGLRPAFWGQGYAFEAAKAVTGYTFASLGAKKLFAGHHPGNDRSRRLLGRLGFIYTGDEFYEPTGLYHPSYELENRVSRTL